MHTTLVLTHDCNLACGYCYAGEKDRRAMPADVGMRALDLAFAAPGPIEIGYFGGEPLIAWDHLVALATLARVRAGREGRVLAQQVTTNGTLLDRSRVGALEALGVSITVSLDGTREAHEATRPQRGGRSSYDAVVAGARAVRDAGLPLDVIAVVAPANVRWLGASVRLLADMGARTITLNPCYEAAWTDDDLVAWEHELLDVAALYVERMLADRPLALPTLDNKLRAAAKGGLSACDRCGAGVGEIAVAPSGRLYPCARLVGDDRGTTWVIGDVEHGVDRSRVAAIRRGPADEACVSCEERWRCSASCMCANLAETRTTDLPGGVQCWHEKTTARIADAVGRGLLEQRCDAFLAWTYGRVAQAITTPRRRRLTVVEEARR